MGYLETMTASKHSFRGKEKPYSSLCWPPDWMGPYSTDMDYTSGKVLHLCITQIIWEAAVLGILLVITDAKEED